MAPPRRLNCKICNKLLTYENRYSGHTTCKECQGLRFKERYHTDPAFKKAKIESSLASRKRSDKYLETNRKYDKSEKRKAWRRKWEAAYKKNNPLFRVAKNLRKNLNQHLKTKGFRKSYHFDQYCGCSIEELKLWLQNKFLPGMSWNNYGTHTWTIDHIIPLASAKTEHELYKLCHYTNLLPLWASDNKKKSDKILP